MRYLTRAEEWESMRPDYSLADSREAGIIQKRREQALKDAEDGTLPGLAQAHVMFAFGMANEAIFMPDEAYGALRNYTKFREGGGAAPAEEREMLGAVCAQYAPETGVCAQILLSALTAALGGDRFSEDFLTRFHKFFCRKENSRLKKITKLTVRDAESVGDMDDPCATGRVVGMALLLRLPVEGDGVFLFRMLESEADGRAREAMRIREAPGVIPCTEEAGSLRTRRPEREMRDMMDAMLECLHVDPSFPEECAGYYCGADDDPPDRIRDLVPRDIGTVEALYEERWPDRKHGTEDMVPYTYMFRILRTLRDTSESLSGMCLAMAGEACRAGALRWKEVLPEKDAAASPEDTAKADALEAEISLLERENAKLRGKLDVKEGDIRALWEENRELKAKLAKSRKADGAGEEMRLELRCLRDYVHGMTEDDGGGDGDVPAPEEEEIAGKRIVIVGGPEKWQARMSGIFPKWKLIPAGVEPKSLSPVLARADMAFFYTGYLSHSQYHKAIGAVRKSGLDFGFISSTNPEKAIKDIYMGLKSHGRI